MSKFIAIAALVGTTAIAGCTQGINPTDTDRALIGAGVGATVASVSGENVLKGAAIGGAAGAIVGDVSEDAMTPETRTYIMENRTESVVLDSDLAVGTVVPETATIQTVPNSNVQYVYVNDRPVVVNPESREIVYIYE